MPDCPHKNRCPHLGFESAQELLAERDRLRREVKHGTNLLEEAARRIHDLRAALAKVAGENNDLRDELQKAHQKPFKPNRQPGEDPNDDHEATPEDSPTTPRPRGRPKGHAGVTRKKPNRIDDVVELHPEHCPRCGGRDLSPCQEGEEHIQEDIEIAKAKTTCFRHHKYFCPHCKKVITAAPAPGEIPHSFIGPIARATAGFLRYQMKIPFRQVKAIFSDLFGLQISPGALVGWDQDLGQRGRPFYEMLREKVRFSDHIHADDTGWRADGVNYWLAVYTNENLALYTIDRHRSQAAVEKTLGESYGGILITDCYSAYNPIQAAAKQKCVTHLLRTNKEVEENNKGNPEAQHFCAEAKRLLQEGLALHRQFRKGALTQDELQQASKKLAPAMAALTAKEMGNEDAERFRQRLLRHKDEVWTCLDHPQIEPTNNRAERQLRPSVIMRWRAARHGNRSDTGTMNHTVLMSLMQTAKLNGANPLHILHLLTQPDNHQPAVELLFGHQPQAPRPPPSRG